MIRIKTDKFLDAVSEMENLPNVLKSYIPTDYDLERMEENPDKYMEFMNYFVTVDRSGIGFEDKDAERLKRVEKKINSIIDDNLCLVD